MSTLTKVSLLSCLLGALFVAGAATTPAHAQATRTWISGVGDDANPCSRTAPCKTWAGAIAKTVAGGEIDALDPGGFGGVTITKSITLDGGGGQVASILTSATAGINIVASQTNDVVIIRNLRFDGLLGNGTGSAGTPGTTGVNIVSAARVVIEKCDIFGFATAGILDTTSSGTIQIKVQETTVNNNGVGLKFAPTGSAVVNSQIERSHFDNNVGGGIRADDTGGGTNNMSVTDTSMSLNGGNGFIAISGTGNTNADLMRTVLSENAQGGVVANNSAGGQATVTVGSSILSYNTSGAWGNPSGTAALQSFKNNQVTGAQGVTPAMASFQ